MLDEHALINIETPDFTAVVRPLSEMPAMKLMPIITSSDAGQQFHMTVELFRDQLSVDKLAELDNLNIQQLTAVVTKWVESF